MHVYRVLCDKCKKLQDLVFGSKQEKSPIKVIDPEIVWLGYTYSEKSNFLVLFVAVYGLWMYNLLIFLA